MHQSNNHAKCDIKNLIVKSKTILSQLNVYCYDNLRGVSRDVQTMDIMSRN